MSVEGFWIPCADTRRRYKKNVASYSNRFDMLHSTRITKDEIDAHNSIHKLKSLES